MSKESFNEYPVGEPIDPDKVLDEAEKIKKMIDTEGAPDEDLRNGKLFK